jgi:uncharacterized protein YbjQ (UPF0145 family)
VIDEVSVKMAAELQAEERKAAHRQVIADLHAGMLITSGYNFEGYSISRYRGFVSTEVVFGMGLFKSIFSDMSDIFGTESNSLNDKFQAARSAAIHRLQDKTIDLGGNAIIGIDIDITTLKDTLICVAANGTAVSIVQQNQRP